jgi:hypothetical protein
MAIAAAGCSASSEEGSAKVTTPGPDIIVSADNTVAPHGCRPGDAARLLVRFVAAISNSDGATAKSFIGSDFKWFSVTGTTGPTSPDTFSTRDAEAFARYVNRRPHEGILRLRSVEVAWPTWHGGADIAFDGAWGAQEVVGKAAIGCQGTVKVWSMAFASSPPQPVLCPAPAGRQLPPGAVIACARHR